MRKTRGLSDSLLVYVTATQAFGIHALPCLRFERQTPKPMHSSYPENPVSIGDHIRKKRMELKLLQKDVAKIIKVTEDCITLWEKNHSEPQINYIPEIIEFLGYCPIEFDESTLSGRLKAYRWKNGLSNKKLGRILKVNGSTVLSWENSNNIPKKEHLLMLEAFLKKCTR